MGKCSSTITEVRFVFEPELTHCYVACVVDGDCPLGTQGWHHKAFPGTRSAIEILRDDAPHYLLWPLEAP